MAITSGDLAFVASARMSDDMSTTPGVGGGGAASGTEVVDNVDNNCFTDLTPTQRTLGAQQLRCVYPSVLSLNADALYDALVGFDTLPSDPKIHLCAFTHAADSNNLAVAARAALRTSGILLQRPRSLETTEFGGTNTATTITLNSGVSPAVGDLIRLSFGVVDPFTSRATIYDARWRVVTAVSGPDVTYDGSNWHSGTQYARGAAYRRAASPVADVSAMTYSSVAASASDTLLEVDELWRRVEPVGSSSLQYLESVGADDILAYQDATPAGIAGCHPIFMPGDLVLIEHKTVPATRELGLVTRVDHLNSRLYLSAGLANAYPNGSKVSRPLRLGNMHARGTVLFAQLAWARLWSDTLMGMPANGGYAGSLGVTNAGARTDRYAAVFRTATDYDVYSEALGYIGQGDTAHDFLPLNPLTSQPLFQLSAASWVAGWATGNALRWNTYAAQQPVWLCRLTEAGAVAAGSGTGLYLHGDVNT